ncbi:unnamed protein product [Microthlaspi erraticum]|uniref:Uncharacterized protein n=1 Tax=Microthlaspi erraticum TaxID=1685480 RepID=A0A6D2ITL0_9BRAS|nr:unnamed protein product [Microthlaspi erraticum]
MQVLGDVVREVAVELVQLPVVAEQEASRLRSGSWTFGGFGRECSAECGDCVGDPCRFFGGCWLHRLQWQRAAEVEQPRAAVVGVLLYLEMIGQIQRIATPLFEGGVWPEEAEMWRLPTHVLCKDGFESYVLFDSEESNYFITTERAESSCIQSSAGERLGMVKVAGGGFRTTSGRVIGVDIQIAG